MISQDASIVQQCRTLPITEAKKKVFEIQDRVYKNRAYGIVALRCESAVEAIALVILMQKSLERDGVLETICKKFPEDAQSTLKHFDSRFKRKAVCSALKIEYNDENDHSRLYLCVVLLLIVGVVIVYI